MIPKEKYLEELYEDEHSHPSVPCEVHSERRGDNHSSKEEQEYPSWLDNKSGKGRKKTANGECCMPNFLEVEWPKIRAIHISLTCYYRRYKVRLTPVLQQRRIAGILRLLPLDRQHNRIGRKRPRPALRR